MEVQDFPEIGKALVCCLGRQMGGCGVGVGGGGGVVLSFLPAT